MRDKYLKYLCKTNFFLTKTSSRACYNQECFCRCQWDWGSMLNQQQSHFCLQEGSPAVCVAGRERAALAGGLGTRGTPKHIWAAAPDSQSRPGKASDRGEVTRELLKNGEIE